MWTPVTTFIEQNYKYIYKILNIKICTNMHNKKKEYIFGILSYAISKDTISLCAAATMHTLYKALPMYSIQREVC